MLIDAPISREQQPFERTQSTVILPAPHLITNQDLAIEMTSLGVTTQTGKPVTAEGIFATTGIRQRFALQALGKENPNVYEQMYRMRVKAASKALESRGWQPEEIDLIYFSGSYPDSEKKSRQIADSLKAGNTDTVDIYGACTGGIYALETAMGKAGKSGKILLVTLDGYSIHMRPTDLHRGVFGDIATATTIDMEDFEIIHKEAPAYEPPALDENGKEKEPEISMPIDISLVPKDSLVLPVPRSRDQYFNMKGNPVYRWILQGSPFQQVESAYKEVMKQHGHKLQENGNQIYLANHPGSGRITPALAERLHEHEVDVIVAPGTVDYMGNPGSGGIFTSFHSLLKKYIIREGDVIMFLGMGAGLHSRTMALRAKRDIR